MKESLYQSKENKHIFINDLTIWGMLNIFLITLSYIGTQYYIYSKGYFADFEKQHWLIWTVWYLLGIIYLIYSVYTVNSSPSKLKTIVYKNLTEGGLYNLVKFLKYNEEHTINEIIVLVGITLLPVPFIKKMTISNKILLVFSKIGAYHLISSILGDIYLKCYSH